MRDIRRETIREMVGAEPTDLLSPIYRDPFMAPAVPHQNDVWWDVQGTLGTEGSSFTWKIYQNGAWVTVYAITF